MKSALRRQIEDDKRSDTGSYFINWTAIETEMVRDLHVKQHFLSDLRKKFFLVQMAK